MADGLTVGLGVVLSGVVLLRHVILLRYRLRLARQDPSALVSSGSARPVLFAAFGVFGVMHVLLLGHFMAARLAVAPRILVLGVCVSALASGAGFFHLQTLRFSRGLADIGMGLVTLGVAVGFALMSPYGGEGFSARMPVALNAMSVGLAVMLAVWVWAGRVWRQQLDGGVAWTAAGRLSTAAPQFSFFAGCLTLVTLSLMSFWPMFRSISTSDGSLRRFACGIGGHLIAMCALFWAGRVARRGSFHALCALATASLLAFVVVRTVPFASTVIGTVSGVAAGCPSLLQPAGGRA